MQAVTATGLIKQTPEDFIVKENLHFEPDGDGEHLLVNIKRKGMTTAEVVRRLSQASGVQRRNISFSGTKDKYAIATQWFSLWLPGKTFETHQLEAVGLEVLTSGRHRRKLKRGVHKTNSFELMIREFSGDIATLNQSLEHIAAHGYANFFGQQRFGRNRSNLQRADQCQNIDELGRQERSFTLSAIRAEIFNTVLEARLREDPLLQLQQGDLAQFSDGGSFFSVDAIDERLVQRQQSKLIVPTGPLWGMGGSMADESIAKLENQLASRFSHYVKLLEQAKMSADRRALKVYPQALQWQWLGKQSLKLSFTLPKSAYATSLVDNLIITGEPE